MPYRDQPQRSAVSWVAIIGCGIVTGVAMLGGCGIAAFLGLIEIGRTAASSKPTPPINDTHPKPAPVKGVGPAIYAWDHADSMLSGSGKDAIERRLGSPDFKSRKWWYYDNRQAQSGNFDIAIHFDSQGAADNIIVQKASPNRTRQRDE